MRALAAIVVSAFLGPALAQPAPCEFKAPASGPPPAVPLGTRVGLALGSGSVHGFAHVGVLLELEARGLPVQVVAGTSAGALVGSLWASGLDAQAIAALARGEALDFGSLSASWQGLYNSEPMRKPLEAAFRARPIEAWPRRFGAVATNLADGSRRLLASGDGVAAVQASAAIPVMFMPIKVRGERLVDGALVEPVPVRAARELGAGIVVAVDVAYRPHEEEVSGLTAYAFQAFHILVNSLSQAQASAAEVVIRPSLHHVWMKCGREGLIAAGREAVAVAWPDILRALARAGPR